MIEGNLDWLMRWYLAQCDNDWEHGYGIEIGTLDDGERARSDLD
jgi:hypothetical protein